MDKIKEFFKNLKPWQWAAIAATAVLAFFALSRRNTGAVQVAAPVSDSGSAAAATSSGAMQEISGKMYEITSNLNDALAAQDARITAMAESAEANNNSLISAFNNISNSFSSYQTATENIVRETSRSLETQISQMKAETSKQDAIDPATYERQKAATSEIVSLQNMWKDAAAKANADGKIDATEAGILDTIHQRANKIGIDAGLGDGGPDGSKRKMVY